MFWFHESVKGENDKVIDEMGDDVDGAEVESFLPWPVLLMMERSDRFVQAGKKPVEIFSKTL